MARARNPKRSKAKEIWLKSGGKKHLKDIAAELEISPSQVRKWKSLDKWSDELKGSVTNGEKERYQSSRHNKNAVGNAGGAPPGNQNAVGNNGGAPVGNKNALVTGQYETLDFDTMTEAERDLFTGVTDDPLVTLNTQIRTLKIRQHRIMARITSGKKKKSLDELGKLDKALDSVSSALTRAVQQKQQIVDSVGDERRRLLEIKVKLAEADLLESQEKTGELGMRKAMSSMSDEELRKAIGGM